MFVLIHAILKNVRQITFNKSLHSCTLVLLIQLLSKEIIFMDIGLIFNTKNVLENQIFAFYGGSVNNFFGR